MPVHSVRLVLVVPLDVLGEVVAPHEFLLAHAALELLFAGVGPLVAGQLIGAGEPLVAVRPLADEGSLAGVNPLVGLQVAALEVVLAALGETAFVDATSGGRRLGCRDSRGELLLGQRGHGGYGRGTLLGGHCAEQDELAGRRSHWGHTDGRQNGFDFLLLGLFRWSRWSRKLWSWCLWFLYWG